MTVSLIEYNKETVELCKIILAQNEIILQTNKMLLEYLAMPAMVIESDDLRFQKAQGAADYWKSQGAK